MLDLFGRGRGRTLLLSASTAAIVACATPVMAQEQARDFDIPAQSLASALIEFSRQSDIMVIVDPAVVNGRQAPALRGSFEPSRALAQLIEGSGLTASRQPGGGFVLGDTSSPTRLGAASGFAPSGLSAEVTGGVRDARTGAALRGALVRIEETGQTTSTNELGDFRFPEIRAGSYTLRISYLGYEDIVRSVSVVGEDRLSEAFEMATTSDETLVVYGQRSARAQALNQERTAENSSTIISADLLGQFEGSTISDALRRAPGLAFQPDLETGEGGNVIVRGLAPDLNTITFNGMRLAVGNGSDRSPALNNILTDSISSITINKTLLPSQDSSGTGGLIEIETRGPLDRPHRYANFGAESSRSDGDFLGEDLYTATLSGTFGPSHNLGLSASIQYRERDISQISTSTSLRLGDYLPLTSNGNIAYSIFDIDPRTPFPFDGGSTIVRPESISIYSRETNITNLAYTLSAQYQFGGHTNWRLDYTRSEQEQDNYRRGQTIGMIYEYAPQPIAELGGDMRGVPIWQDVYADFGLPGSLMYTSQDYGFDLGGVDTTSVLSFQGETRRGRWTFNYDLGFTEAANERPERLSLFLQSNGPLFGYVDVSPYLLPEALAQQFNGRVISPFLPRTGNELPLPLLNSDGFALFNDAANIAMPAVTTISEGAEGENERRTARLSGRYEFDHPHLRYLEAGVFYEQSNSHAAFGDRAQNISFLQPLLLSYGLALSENSLEAIGVQSAFNVVSRGDMQAFLRGLTQLDASLVTVTPVVNDPRLDQTRADEEELSGYVQGRVEFGDFELIGGVRIDRTTAESVNLRNPILILADGNVDTAFAEQFRDLVDDSASGTDILPRLLLNYRPNDNFVARAGYYSTVARPALSQLSQRQDLLIDLRPIWGPSNNARRVQVFEGNPDLNPAITHNLDLSLEYYSNDIGALKAALFYKDTENLIFDNYNRPLNSLDGVELPDYAALDVLSSGNVFVQGTRPENSDDPAEAWGIELSVERRFDFLPAPFNGLGVYANYTHTESSRVAVLPYAGSPTGAVLVDGAPYLGQPEDTGSLALTYSGHGVDASLAYTRQARYLSTLSAFDMSSYQEAIDTLDLRVQYLMRVGDNDLRFYFEGVDLLKGTDDPDAETSRGGENGSPRYYDSANYIGGRTFRFGVAASF